MIACVIARYPFSLRNHIAHYQSFGQVRAGKDIIDTTCWQRGRTGKAVYMRMEMPVTIYVSRVAYKLDAATRRINACGGIKKAAQYSIARNGAQERVKHAQPGRDYDIKMGIVIGKFMLLTTFILPYKVA